MSSCMVVAPKMAYSSDSTAFLVDEICWMVASADYIVAFLVDGIYVSCIVFLVQ